MSTAINLFDALNKFNDQWSPKRVTTLNDYDIKVVKVKGEFVWHKHDDTDELFLVLSGKLIIQFHPEDRENVVLGPNDIFVVPKGMQHCPKTEGNEEVSILLIEPKGVVNTGDAEPDAVLTNNVEDL